jgi:CRISPR type IV-associated protein Csf3
MAVRSVRHIGIMRRHGYGRVRKWEIVEADTAPDQLLVGLDGRAARHLPAEWCIDNQSVDVGAVLPPYWHPGRNQPRVRFGCSAKLREEVYAAVSRLT